MADANEIMRYLKKHQVADQLNAAVNALCKARTQDPFGRLSRTLGELASPAAVTRLVGREVLSSRATPTVRVEVYCRVKDEERLVASATAGVRAPGKSRRGRAAALDGDAKRFAGAGATKSAASVSSDASGAVAGLDPANQRSCDAALGKLAGANADDASASAPRLGGRALAAASVAICKAAARLSDVSCYLYIRSALFTDAKRAPRIPMPMIHLISGGSGNALGFPEILVLPGKGAKTFRQGLDLVARVRGELAKALEAKYGPALLGATPRGGFAPPVDDAAAALALVTAAAEAAGLAPGNDVIFALAGGAWANGYEVKMKEAAKSVDEMIEFYVGLAKTTPGLGAIVDPLAGGDDWASWSKLKEALGADELKGRKIRLYAEYSAGSTAAGASKCAEAKAASGMALQIEQSGTLSELAAAARAAADAKLVTVAACPAAGGTADTFIADLAVAMAAKYAKFGGLSGAESTAKYNRLLDIEAALQREAAQEQ